MFRRRFLMVMARGADRARSTMGRYPHKVWEVVNQLYSWAAQTPHQAVDRRTRRPWAAQSV
jgi:hypothetical protein